MKALTIATLLLLVACASEPEKSKLATGDVAPVQTKTDLKIYYYPPYPPFDQQEFLEAVEGKPVKIFNGIPFEELVEYLKQYPSMNFEVAWNEGKYISYLSDLPPDERAIRKVYARRNLPGNKHCMKIALEKDIVVGVAISETGKK